jgi:hypothetical protein
MHVLKFKRSVIQVAQVGCMAALVGVVSFTGGCGPKSGDPYTVGLNYDPSITDATYIKPREIRNSELSSDVHREQRDQAERELGEAVAALNEINAALNKPSGADARKIRQLQDEAQSLNNSVSREQTRVAGATSDAEIADRQRQISTLKTQIARLQADVRALGLLFQ